MSKYKIIMTGGGTAGHVNPNLALIPSLEKNNFEVKYISSISLSLIFLYLFSLYQKFFLYISVKKLIFIVL